MANLRNSTLAFYSPEGIYFPNETFYKAARFTYEAYVEKGGNLSFEDWYYEVHLGLTPQFIDIAKFRNQLNLPSAGSPADKSTVAMIEVNGEKIFGINAHGQPVNDVNAISKTHAEIDALNQIKQRGTDVSGQSLTLYVDRAPCAACGINGGIRSMVEQLGLKQLTVVSPDGILVITPR